MTINKINIVACIESLSISFVYSAGEKEQERFSSCKD